MSIDLAFVGIDPGLVHTGIVGFGLSPKTQTFQVEHLLLDGVDDAALTAAAEFCEAYPHEQVFIEAYRPRSAFTTDARMGKAVNDFKRVIRGSRSLDNTGVKKVVRQPLMQALGVWHFAQSTHHQDLRAAARIGLYGALKDDELNAVLTQFIIDHLAGHSWTRL